MNELVNKQLIFDSFAGKATILQRKLIDEWCQVPHHEELFYAWLEEWEQAHLQYVANQEQGLNRYHHFLDHVTRPANPNRDTPPNPVFGVSRPTWLIWLVAASVALVVGCWRFQHQLLNHTYATTYGETRLVRLTDGSQVTLNANSKLRVPRFGFGRETRQVWLEGEALFSVTHTASHQRFVVKTDHGADVVVLGTEFTLFARPRGTQVVLQRGKVEFHYHKPGQEVGQVVLKPGDRVDLEKNGTVRLQPTLKPANYSAWRDHRYVFEKTSLLEIADLFKENFGVTLKISDPKTAALTLSGAYPAQNANELLSIITEALNIQIIPQRGEFLLAPQSM